MGKVFVKYTFNKLIPMKIIENENQWFNMSEVQCFNEDDYTSSVLYKLHFQGKLVRLL